MMRIGAVVCAAILACACTSDQPETPGQDAGERMYRGGILTSGDPMTALVGGDIPIVGTQFSCENCHGRSGMGAAEGPYVVPPVAGQFLFAPSPQPQRPAYDRQSLAVLLRDGMTPSGRMLSPELMPRYVLGDDDVDALADYLGDLSSGNSPGVDATEIHFATIVGEEVDAAAADAMLSVLRRFAEDINRQTRNESERWDRLHKPESKLPTVFRDWVIDEWRLSGPRERWAEQLEQYYADQPVFAVVSGAGVGSWRPVSEFCERNKVACLYPSTDLPYRRDEDFYTVYFSGGLILEAKLAAAHLMKRDVSSVVQVYCDPAHEPVVDTLRDALTNITTHAISFDCDRALPLEHLQALSGNGTAVVLWLEREQMQSLPKSVEARSLYMSSILTGAAPPAEVGNGREAYMVHPYRLPGKVDPAMRRFEAWARSRNIAVTAPQLQAEAYFACLVTKDAVKHMRRYFIREFALDMLDHAESLGAYLPNYEQPSFGPGQRFISKGGYVVPVIDGEIDTKSADWILP